MDHIIFHIDVNSAFLSWSALKYLREGHEVDLREIPSIVGGDQASRHGIVVAKSIPAKKYGIKTADTVASAFLKCPNLVQVSPDRSFYSEQSHLLMNYLTSICPIVEQASIDECYMEYGPLKEQYSSPIEAAHAIKDQVRERFGFTVNIGISDRKVLAKMASDFQKPDRVHTLYASEIKRKMWPLPIEDLHMCGSSTCKKLRSLGVKTIGGLAEMDPDIVQSLFKSHGMMLWKFANGQDDREVNPVREKVKGVGNSTTLAQDVTDRYEAYKTLKELSLSVSNRLKKHHFLAGSVCVEIKYADFSSFSHQCTLENETDDPQTLYKYSCRLFDQLWNQGPIRLLGVRTTKLKDKDEPTQINLFEYQKEIKVSEKQKKLDDALAKIRNRFGDDAIKKGI